MRRQRGYTLVEILVALLILTLVITMSLAAFVQRNKRLQQATEIMLAYQSLANETEYRRRMSYDSLVNETTFLSDTTLLQPLEPYTTAVDVKETEPGVKRVDLSIHWHDGQRVAQLEVIRVDTGGTNLW